MDWVFRLFCSQAGGVLCNIVYQCFFPTSNIPLCDPLCDITLPSAAKICSDPIWKCKCKPSETKIIVEIFCVVFYENSFYCGCKDSEFLNALSVLLPTFSNLENKIWSKKYPQLRWDLQAGANRTNSISFFDCHLCLCNWIWDMRQKKLGISCLFSPVKNVANIRFTTNVWSN